MLVSRLDQYRFIWYILARLAARSWGQKYKSNSAGLAKLKRLPVQKQTRVPALTIVFAACIPSRAKPGMSPIVKVFGCRPTMTAPRTPGPAYENLQGNRGREGADRAARLERCA
jgi:hypothetical protein